MKYSHTNSQLSIVIIVCMSPALLWSEIIEAFNKHMQMRERLKSRPVSKAISYRHLMKNHSSYFGIMSGLEAEQLLTAMGKDCYLTRYSQLNEAYLLSVMKMTQNGDNHFEHFKLMIDNEKEYYEIDGYEKSFKNIDELLDYYQSNPITPRITNIGQCLSRDDVGASVYATRETSQQNDLQRHSKMIEYMIERQQQLETNMQLLLRRIPSAEHEEGRGEGGVGGGAGEGGGRGGGGEGGREPLVESASTTTSHSCILL